MSNAIINDWASGTESDSFKCTINELWFMLRTMLEIHTAGSTAIVATVHLYSLRQHFDCEAQRANLALALLFGAWRVVRALRLLCGGITIRGTGS